MSRNVANVLGRTAPEAAPPTKAGPYRPEEVDGCFPFFDVNNPTVSPEDRANTLIAMYVQSHMREAVTAIDEWHRDKRKTPPIEAVQKSLDKITDALSAILSGRPAEPKQRATNSSDGYVYVMRPEGGLCKIGKAVDIAARRKTFQTASATRVAVLFSRKVKYYGLVESILHTEFKGKHIRGEWYDLNEADIERVSALVHKHAAADGAA